MTIETTTLPSGLRVVTDSRPDATTVALTVNIAAGSRHESESEHGLAHLLEHMAFKGTRSRSARAIAEEIESVGGDINAATATEQTTYMVRVLPEDTALAVELLADILLNSTFDPEELSREKGVILQEIGAVEDTPDDLVFDAFMETAFAGQPIGLLVLPLMVFHQIQLIVWSDNRAAENSYTRLGFRCWGTMPRADIIDGIALDYDHMVLMLDHPAHAAPKGTS